VGLAGLRSQHPMSPLVLLRTTGVNLLPNQALHSDRGLSSVLHQVFSRVPAQAPAPFSAPPRSAKVDVPRRVNASIVRQTVTFAHRHGLPAFSIALRSRPA
jgi:hypothetical protein